MTALDQAIAERPCDCGAAHTIAMLRVTLPARADEAHDRGELAVAHALLDVLMLLGPEVPPAEYDESEPF